MRSAPPRLPWTREEVERCTTLLNQGMRFADVAKQLNTEFHRGKPVRNANALSQRLYAVKQGRRHRTLTDAVATSLPTSGAVESEVVDGDNRHVTLRSTRIKTLDEALAFKQVDLERYAVQRCKLNTWEVGAKGPDGRIVVEPLHQVDFTLVPKVHDTARIRQLLLDDVRQAAPIALVRKTPRQTGVALELDLFDLHLGKQGWRAETGENTDLRRTELVADAAIDTLLTRAQSFAPSCAVFPLGNDWTQIDSRRQTTTAGTLVDADTRYWRIVRHARALASRVIRTLVKEVGPVTVPIVPGNHDEHTTIMIGELLAVEFGGSKHVKIDNSLYPRKYWKHGINLLGFAHGNEEKHADLPLLMATEQPELWATSEYREWHVGHYHKSKETRFNVGDTFNGVGVRVIRALSGADFWHVRHGYRSLRMAEAFLWDAEDGMIGNVTHWHREPLEIPASVVQDDGRVRATA